MKDYYHLGSRHDLAEWTVEVFCAPGMMLDSLVAYERCVNFCDWWLTKRREHSGLRPKVKEIPPELLGPIARLVISCMIAQHELDAGKVPAIEAAVLEADREAEKGGK